MNTWLRLRLLAAHAINDFLMNKLSLGSWDARSMWARRVAHRVLPGRYGRIQCPTIFGYDVVMEQGTSRQLYWYGFYERGTLDVIRRVLRPGDVFVDAGASIGVMSLYAATQAGPTGRVLSFEPTPVRYSCLTESIKLNGFTNMKAFNFGLGAETKETKIFTGAISPSMIEEAQAGNVVAHPSHVEPLSEVLKREGVGTVRMIKIDVEGYELDVLRGCEDILRGDDPPALCIEYGHYRQDEVDQLLRSLDGYGLFRMRETKDQISDLVELAPGEKLAWGDNIFAIPVGMRLAN